MKSGDRITPSSPNNPYHSYLSGSSSRPEEEGVLGSLKEGFNCEVDDLVKLELTAEQMLGDEVDLAKAYVREDTQGVWNDMKLGLSEFEMIAAEWLLSAADPTRVEWQAHHWWEDEESQFRH